MKNLKFFIGDPSVAIASNYNLGDFIYMISNDTWYYVNSPDGKINLNEFKLEYLNATEHHNCWNWKRLDFPSNHGTPAYIWRYFTTWFD